MKTTLFKLLSIALVCGQSAWGQAGGSFTNFIRQVNKSPAVEWDASVAATGSQSATLPVTVGGARFELWTVLSTPLTSYLLDSKSVGAYMPTAEVIIHSEDPYTEIPRTRADRPFSVEIKVSGLLDGSADPQAAKSVTLLRHVQSYGTAGDGRNIDRSQATLLNQATITTNGTRSLEYPLTSVPGADRSKVCGEERYSVFGPDLSSSTQGQIASRYIQIWPVADATLSGMVENQVIRFKAPDLTVVLNDLYPSSHTYAQVYPGAQKLGTTGSRVPEVGVVANYTTSQDSTLTINNYDSLMDSDGTWTMEILTETPFGIDRLAHVSFQVDRTMSVNGNVTTME